MLSKNSRKSHTILRQRIDYTTYDLAVKEILHLSKEKKSAYICIAIVHMVMESYDNKEYCEMVNAATLITPDGMPLVWALRRLGIRKAERVYGPTLMMELLKECANNNIPVGLYGGKEEVLNILLERLPIDYPRLKISYAVSPPFRKLKNDEEEKIISDMVLSGSKIIFIGLGCPKQEIWMAKNSKYLPMPLLGVGAAFNFLAFPNTQAPKIFQRTGLEWLFRLFTEPRRLWFRYLYNNPRFVIKIIKQIVREKFA